MRVLVCGDRHWTDSDAILTALTQLLADHGAVSVIEGGASGADKLAWDVANTLHLPVDTVIADWPQYGLRAGPIRNRAMLDMKPDLVLAFHANIERSRGTKDCVAEARRRGIPVRVITA